MNNSNYVFGGRIHFQSFYERHFLNVFVPLELIPINGYYYEKEGLEEFLFLHFKRYMNDTSFGKYNLSPLDNYTLKISCEKNLLTDKEILFCSKSINEFNAQIIKFNEKKDQVIKIANNIINEIKKEELFKFKLNDQPILDLPVKSVIGPYFIKDYYRLKIKNLLQICPILIEYLILNTQHFCIEDFDISTAYANAINHSFLELTFRVNDAKLKLASQNSTFSTCKDFEINRIKSIIETQNKKIKKILFFSELDDYDRPRGEDGRIWSNALHYESEYIDLLNEI